MVAPAAAAAIESNSNALNRRIKAFTGLLLKLAVEWMSAL
jgi:hypothetical protein